MLQVRIHGRGGQGVVTAAELLSVAAFIDGHHAQAVPSFGSERTGAPVVAFCRIDDHPIRSHEPVQHPDVVVVQDPSLLGQADVVDGLVAGGLLLVNTSELPADAPAAVRTALERGCRLVTVPATEIAQRHTGRPLPNAALLGALAALHPEVVALESVVAAIRGRFAATAAETNVAAALEAAGRVPAAEPVHA